MRIFDYSSLKEKTWDCEIISLVAQIHEYKGRQEVYLKQKPEALDKLIEIAKRQSTEASNAIEGIRTTSTRLKQLCEKKTTPKNRDEEEILGYRDVLNTIHENYEYIPIRTNYILQLHRDLYKYTGKSIGGHFKVSQNVIADTNEDGKEYVLFTSLEPYETPSAIDSICENYNRMIESEDVDSILLIPIFIHDFLCIHPFSDGNGRMSRLLTALLLYKSGYVVGKYISIENKITGYVIKYSTNKKMKKRVKTKVIKNPKTGLITINKLLSKRRYYVKIATYKLIKGKKYYSNYSKVKKVKTK
ncbi:Fic family protein [Eubacterium sp.]|uniref:Fic family protein n=1 Tax=Eubacterium sp. TaxID=142586 RepID=UPI003521685B